MIRDRVSIRADGTWVYKERLDLVINRGGAKLSLEHVERRLYETFKIPFIAVGVANARLGQELAVVAVKGVNEVSTASVIQFIQSEFSIALPPEHIRFIEKFPLNGAAKIDRKQLNVEFAVS